jgi:hypothetical protein
VSGGFSVRIQSTFPEASRGVSADPEFAAKAAEIVGLYMVPPDNAVVRSPSKAPQTMFPRTNDSGYY